MEIGDSENIGYPANYFDAVTFGFWSEISKTYYKGLLEILRVLRPGDLIILENRSALCTCVSFTSRLYTHFVMPLIGWFF